MILSFLAWLAIVAFAGTVLAEAWLPWRDRTDALERIVLTLGLGYAWAVVAGMALNATPWGVNVGSLIVATFALALLVGGGQRIRGGKACGRPRPLDRRTWLAVALVIAFAALFRLPNLGWSEFQGDEALVLHKAAATIDGRHDAIYVHKKGPAEILVTAEVYAITRRIDEGTARLPFAVAMLAGLAALFVVARGLFGARVAPLAALILGLNGFFIAFGRVVQYQALVFLFGTVALWCAWRYRTAGPHPPTPSPKFGGGGGREAEGGDAAGVEGEFDIPLDPTLPHQPVILPLPQTWGRGSGGEGLPQEQDAPRWLLLTALFLACGLLSHYDAALVAPAILWLVVARWRADRGSLRRDRWAIAASVVLGAVLLASFYVPFVLHPYFRSTTLKYLVEVRMGGGGGGGGGAPYDALPRWAGLANFYNSAYYLIALGLLVAAVVTKRLVARWPRAGWALAALGAAGVPALLLRPQWFALTADIEGRSWAIVLVAALALAPLIAVWRDDAWATVWLWLMVPFVFYSTLVESPRTHFHTVFPALSILAALAFTLVRPRPPNNLAQSFAGSVMGLTIAISAYYGWQVFVQHEVAYKREWPAVRVPNSWYPFSDLPSSGWFGFPYRVGWKAIGNLRWGGEFDSNEEPAVTSWYTRGAPRCGADARWLFLADAVQDVQPLFGEEDPRDALPSDQKIASAGYAEFGSSNGGGPYGIHIWDPKNGMNHSGDATVRLAPISLSLNHAAILGSGTLESVFDHDLSGPHYDAGLPFDPPIRLMDDQRHDEFGEPARIILDGWRFQPTPGPKAVPMGEEVFAGDEIAVTLAWTAVGDTLPANAQVFVHLEREGERMVGQSDGPLRPPAETVCGKPRALASLSRGESVLDRHVIAIPPDEPRGTYDLLVGIYDYATGERLQVTGGPDAGNNRVRLTSIEVMTEGGP